MTTEPTAEPTPSNEPTGTDSTENAFDAEHDHDQAALKALRIDWTIDLLLDLASRKLLAKRTRDALLDGVNLLTAMKDAHYDLVEGVNGLLETTLDAGASYQYADDVHELRTRLSVLATTNPWKTTP